MQCVCTSEACVAPMFSLQTGQESWNLFTVTLLFWDNNSSFCSLYVSWVNWTSLCLTEETQTCMFVMYRPRQCLWKKWRHSVFVISSNSWRLNRQIIHLNKTVSHQLINHHAHKLCFHLTTGTFLLVRNSLAISMSSNRTGQPQYSSHLALKSLWRKAAQVLKWGNPTWHSYLQEVRPQPPHQDLEGCAHQESGDRTDILKRSCFQVTSRSEADIKTSLKHQWAIVPPTTPTHVSKGRNCSY